MRRDDPQEPQLPSLRLGPFGGYWRVAIIGVLLAGTVVLHGIHGGKVVSGVSAGVTLAFLAAGPGLALMGLLRLDDLVLEISLAVALSLAVETILAMVMLLLRHWVPGNALAAVGLVAAAGAAAQANQVAKLKRRNRLQHPTPSLSPSLNPPGQRWPDQ